VLGGSILEREPGAERLFNTSTFFDPSGTLVAVYRKIHLFDVKAQIQNCKLLALHEGLPLPRLSR
jgi:predicted amidohydrolase